LVALCKPLLDDAALAVVVDQDAEPVDVDRFLDALDRLVERRISRKTRKQTENKDGNDDRRATVETTSGWTMEGNLIGARLCPC
jgi:hypothetical protein